MPGDEQISGLEKIRQLSPPKADENAKAERAAFASGDYDAQDAGDNYNIRKCIKDEFVKRIKWIVCPTLAFAALLIAGLAFLVFDYISWIYSSKEQVETLLTHIFTHSLAFILGICGKFLFPSNRK